MHDTPTTRLAPLTTMTPARLEPSTTDTGRLEVIAMVESLLADTPVGRDISSPVQVTPHIPLPRTSVSSSQATVSTPRSVSSVKDFPIQIMFWLLQGAGFALLAWLCAVYIHILVIQVILGQ